MGPTTSRNVEATKIKSLAPVQNNRPFSNPIVQMTSRVIKSKEELMQAMNQESTQPQRTKSTNKKSIDKSNNEEPTNKAPSPLPIPKKNHKVSAKINFHKLNSLNSISKAEFSSGIFAHKEKTNFIIPSKKMPKAKKQAAPKQPLAQIQQPEAKRVSIAHKTKPLFTDRVHFDSVSLLPPNVFYNVLSYDMNAIRNFLAVSPSWYSSILQSIDDIFNKTENQFIKLYSSYLLFTNSYTSSSKISCSKTTGTKVDRIFTCECLSSCKGCTVTIGYSYSYVGENERHRAQFQFECNSNTKRVMWIHKNDCFVYK